MNFLQNRPESHDGDLIYDATVMKNCWMGDVLFINEVRICIPLQSHFRVAQKNMIAQNVENFPETYEKKLTGENKHVKFPKQNVGLKRVIRIF